MRTIAALVLVLVTTGCGGRQVVVAGELVSGFYALAGASIVHSADGERWATVYQGDKTLAALAHAAGRLVAVGSAGRIVVSGDGARWVVVGSSTTVDLADVTHDGERFVVVGSNWTDGGAVLTSADGEGWRVLAQPQLRPDRVRCVGGRCFVRSGHFGDLPDTYFSRLRGETFERGERLGWDGPAEDVLVRAALGVAADALVTFNDGELLLPGADKDRASLAVRSALSGYIAIGWSEASTSSDGQRWTPLSLPASSAAGDRAPSFHGAAASGDVAIVGFSKGRVLRSTDLVRWDKIAAAAADAAVADAMVRDVRYVP
ncbi:MAG: hypothetical protein KC503_45965 [Myxococcales bacterium]|nr:hypothetical protein [Myxococcales bacterium]